jgi:type I restriction enzyme M protein
MLPMTVLRRFDCVLAPTKDAVLRRFEQVKDKHKDEALESLLNKVSGQRFHILQVIENDIVLRVVIEDLN